MATQLGEINTNTEVLLGSERGAANGVASLDANGFVPNSELYNPIGNLYLSAGVVTPIAVVGTPVKTLGTTILLPSTDFDSPVNGRLRYIGTETKTFVMTASLSMIASAVNRTFNFYFAKNDNILTETAITNSVPAIFYAETIPLLGVVSLTTNDYVEVWVENLSDDTDMALLTLNMTIK